MPAKASGHKWIFKARFRRRAFGWRSQPAIQRIKEAVSEIKKVARRDSVLGGEGAVAFLERVSPALEQVDSSSGAIGAAVNKAIDELVPIVAEAPIDAKARWTWLDRLYAALQADRIPYIEWLGDRWGDLCATKEIASTQADALLALTRSALSSDRQLRGHFCGTSACLSALFRAERFAELAELVRGDVIWPYKRWAVKALVAQGRKAEAIRLAESCRGPWAGDLDIDCLCEDILLSSGMIEEAYERYGLSANRTGTCLATFRAVAKRYPTKGAATILADLVKTTPGEEGKWFAAAKSAGLYQDALALASQSPCDPRTLTRAARDFSQEQPEFAIGAGLLALRWLLEGHGYEITEADVCSAYDSTIKAAMLHGSRSEVEGRIQELIAAESRRGQAVSRILARQMGLT
jgi:hypothetical protein